MLVVPESGSDTKARNSMQDAVKLVSAELRGAWRVPLARIGATWAVCVLRWLAVYFTPDKYEASSRFYVDTSSALAPFVRNLSVEMDVDQQVALVKQLIVGREALLKVARETDLDIEATTPVELDSLLESLRERIMVTGGDPSRANPRERDHNYQISYRDSDRQRAVKVVQIMLDSFIEDTLKKRRSASRMLATSCSSRLGSRSSASPKPSRSWPSSSAATSGACRRSKAATSTTCRAK